MISEMHCSVSIPDILGNSDKELTVGRHIVLNCEGSWDRSFDFSKAEIVWGDEKQKFFGKIFKIDVTGENAFNADLTFYVAGEMDFQELSITDGVSKISLGAQKFKINTVIEKKEGAETQQPYGFMESHLEWPWEYTAGAVGSVVLLILFFVLLLIRRARWSRLMGTLREYDSPIEADSQFYKNVRHIEKTDLPLNDLTKMMKTYILRRYKVPIYHLSRREVMSFLKKHHPRLKEQRRLVFNLLKDLETLEKKATAESTPKNDAEFLEQRKKLVERFYKFIDRTELAFNTGALK